MIPLRANTAFTERVGPFLDETDGHTPETGLTIVRADCQLSKNGGAFAQKDNTGGGTHDTDGWYSISGATTDVDTKGRLKLQIDVAGALPVWVEFLVVEENIYDMLFSNNHDFILKPQSIDFDGGSGSVPAVNLKGGDTAAAAIVLESDTDVIHQTCKTAGGNVLVATAGSAAGDCWKLNSPADAGKALDLNGGPVTGKGLEASGGAADIDAQELIDILADTAEIGTAGAGLTDLGGMSTGMKAEVQAEVDDALNAYDEAAGVASAAALDTVSGVVDAILVDTNEMQGKLPTNNIMGSSVKTDKDDEIDAILVDTAEIGVAGIGLTNLGGMSSAMKAEVNAEVDTALDELIPEPVVGAPSVTCSIRTGMARVYGIARNKGELNGTAGEKTYFNSSGVAISKKAVSDDGTTYEESAMTGV